MRSAPAVPHLRLVLPAVPACVPFVRGEVVALARDCGASPFVLVDVALAVTEAVANVVRHAYPERLVPGLVVVEADVEEGDAEVVVADDGVGLRAGESTGIGTGLAVLGGSCAEFAIRERDSAGLEVWMRFPLRP